MQHFVFALMAHLLDPSSAATALVLVLLYPKQLRGPGIILVGGIAATVGIFALAWVTQHGPSLPGTVAGLVAGVIHAWVAAKAKASLRGAKAPGSPANPEAKG